jgi:hypothetical protein
MTGDRLLVAGNWLLVINLNHCLKLNEKIIPVNQQPETSNQKLFSISLTP